MDGKRWTNESGLYTFEIIENAGHFDLNVKFLLQTDYFWFGSLDAAKRYVRKNYVGLKIGRWEKNNEKET